MRKSIRGVGLICQASHPFILCCLPGVKWQQFTAMIITAGKCTLLVMQKLSHSNWLPFIPPGGFIPHLDSHWFYIVSIKSTHYLTSSPGLAPAATWSASVIGSSNWKGLAPLWSSESFSTERGDSREGPSPHDLPLGKVLWECSLCALAKVKPK